MKRRALSLALALVLIVCMIPLTAFAAEDMQTSYAGVSLIKHFEGFNEYPYWDYSQYSVGYGTRCPDDKLAYYQKNGITESEASKLLEEFLDSFELYVNNFAKRNGLELTQAQFDALVSFTYNVGPSWMTDSEGLVTRAVLNGATGNDFIFAMTMWCTAGGEVLPGLVERRLMESNLYLNGSYAASVPSHYGYVRFDHNDSVYNGESRTVRVQGYDGSTPVEVYPEGVRSGYRFLGWYTAASGGKRITHLDSTTDGMNLYARWQSGDGKVENGVIKGTAASYERSTTGSVKVYAAPDTGASVVYTLDAGTRVSVVADYVDADGACWCRLTDGNWLRLDETKPEIVPAEIVQNEGTLVTITANSMNVRSGPGTSYSLVRKAYKGEQMLLTEIRYVDGTPWGAFDGGWICLDYTDYTPYTGKVIATGTIKLSSGRLNVRAGAGYAYDVVSSLGSGERVELYNIVTADGAKWGQIDKGWISMYYVELDPVKVEPPTEETTEAPTTEAPTEETTEAPTEAPTQPPVEEDKPAVTGTVNITSGTLNVRAGAGSSYKVVASLKKGDRVEILETATVNGTKWGRISKGWVSMSYIKLDPTAADEAKAQNGFVNTVSGPVNIRSGPGTNYALVTKLAKGTAVKIYETKVVGSMTWGRCDQGWVSMQYIKLTSTGSGTGSDSGKEETVTASSRTGTVINCNEVNVRSGAGTSNSKVGTIKVGTKLTFTELKMVYGTAWGKCSAGWVCLDYVRMNAATPGSIVLIDAYDLNVRTGAGTSNSKVGTYTKGDVVTILETTKVGSTTWARSTKGWFSMDYAI